MTRGFDLLFVAALAAACAQVARAPRAEGFEFDGGRGMRWNLQENVAKSAFTVLEFFSSDCPVQRAHDARLVEVYERYHPRGVAFVAVDSEAGATPERDDSERRGRGYPFPILVDDNGRFADWVRASYSTYTIVMDRSGKIRYEGGIDSDHVTLTDGATPYLSDALEDLLSGRAPRLAVGKVSGCMLRKW